MLKISQLEKPLRAGPSDGEREAETFLYTEIALKTIWGRDAGKMKKEAPGSRKSERSEIFLGVPGGIPFSDFPSLGPAPYSFQG